MPNQLLDTRFQLSGFRHFRQSFRQHMAVIAALLHKETVARVQHPLEATLALLEPLALLFALCSAYHFFSRNPPYGTSTMLFLATGFLPYFFFVYISRKIKGIPSRQKRFPVEQPLDYIFVLLILRIFEYSILGVLLFGGMYLSGIAGAFPTNPMPIVHAVTLLAIFSWGVGLINIGIGKLIPVWNYIFLPLAKFFVIFSGLNFVGDLLRPDIRYLIEWNPLYQAMTLFRLGFYPQYPHATLDVGYLAFCALTSLLLGLLIERATRRIDRAKRKF